MYRKLKSLSLQHIAEKDIQIKKKVLKNKKNGKKEEIEPDMKLSVYEKNNIIFDLFEKLDKKNKQNSKAFINKSFFRDLN